MTTVAQPHMWGIDVPEVTLWGEPVEDPAPAFEPPSWDLAVSAPSGAGRAAAPIWAEVVEQERLGRGCPGDEGGRARRRGGGRVGRRDRRRRPRRSGRRDRRRGDRGRGDRRGADRLEAVAELEPVLARTASDPAPMMSHDATTIMPPLSLLPPLPSSRGRGRGRPPVPMSSSRSSAARAAAATPTATPEDLTAPAAAAPAPFETPRVDAGLFDDAPTVKTPLCVRRWSRPPPSRRRTSWPR